MRKPKSPFEYTLLLKRVQSPVYATFGELYLWNVPDNFFPLRYFSIEPTVIKNDKGICCIPTGTYPITFQKMQDHDVFHYKLSEVPEREGIFIHCGNKVSETKGCILVGRSLNKPDMNGEFELSDSKIAIMNIEFYLEKLPCEITIYNG
jgi:hypothetical protein